MLGLLERDPRGFLQAVAGSGGIADTLDAVAIEASIEARAAAKRAKNYAEADRIQGELLAAGVVLEYKPGGATEWRRA